MIKIDKILNEIFIEKNISQDNSSLFNMYNEKEFKKAGSFNKLDIYIEDNNTLWFTISNKPAAYLQYKENTIKINGKNVKGMSIDFYTMQKDFRGQNISLEVYDWLMHKTGCILSDIGQSNGDMKVWTKLSKIYNIYDYDPNTDELFPVEEINGRLESKDPKKKIYGSTRRLIAFKNKIL